MNSAALVTISNDTRLRYSVERAGAAQAETCGSGSIRSRGRWRYVATILPLTLISAGTFAEPNQWLQWGGPNRNFICDSAGALATDWPEGGPTQLWKRELGDGYSTILADGDTLYTMCRRDDKDAVLAIDAPTGKTIWETTYDAPARPGQAVDFGPGPHATPAIEKGRIFTVSTGAKVHCLDQKTGRIIWSHDMIADLGMKDLSQRHLWRGYGASPIVYRDLVIVTAGGEGYPFTAFPA